MLHGHSLCCPSDQLPHNVHSLLHMKLKTLFSFKSPMFLGHAWSSAERQVQVSLDGTWH